MCYWHQATECDFESRHPCALEKALPHMTQVRVILGSRFQAYLYIPNVPVDCATPYLQILKEIVKFYEFGSW